MLASHLQVPPREPAAAAPASALPHALSSEDLLLLFAALDNLKHRCLLQLTYAAGLRLGELVELRLTDLDFAARRVRVAGRNTRPDRWVPVGEAVWRELSNYRQVYQTVDLVFTGARGHRYNPRSVQAVLRRAVALSGIDPATTVHSLRNSFAVHLLEQGTPPEHVRKLMGLATTRQLTPYLRRHPKKTPPNQPQQVSPSLANYHPAHSAKSIKNA